MKNLKTLVCALVLTLLAFTGTFANTIAPPGESQWEVQPQPF